jgi:hypothetical protein
MNRYKALEVAAEKVKVAREEYDAAAAVYKAAKEDAEAKQRRLRDASKEWETEMGKLSPPIYLFKDEGM